MNSGVGPEALAPVVAMVTAEVELESKKTGPPIVISRGVARETARKIHKSAVCFVSVSVCMYFLCVCVLYVPAEDWELGLRRVLLWSLWDLGEVLEVTETERGKQHEKTDTHT